MKNVAIIFGGVSAEHEISIITGKQAYNSLDKKKYNVYPIYIDINGNWLYVKNFKIKNLKQNNKVCYFVPNSNKLHIKGSPFKKITIDCVLLATHGGNGENGMIQGVLEVSNIPYSSCGVLSSAITMDKAIMKDIFVAHNIPTPQYFLLNENSDINNLDYPVVVKPVSLGSSIGIKICHNKKELLDAIKFAKLFDDKIIIEKAIFPLREVNIAVLKHKNQIILSNTEQPLGQDEFLTFEDKYLRNGKSKSKNNSKRKIPALITNEEESKIKKLAIDLYNIFRCKGIIRIDFLLDDNNVYVNELNTIPGSLSYYLWDISYKKLLDILIDCCSVECKHIQYKTNILENYND